MTQHPEHKVAARLAMGNMANQPLFSIDEVLEIAKSYAEFVLDIHMKLEASKTEESN